MESIFSKLVTITGGLHRDKKTDKEFELLINELQLIPQSKNGLYKTNFKRPLSPKKEYYFKLISNEVETEIDQLKNVFLENISEAEHKYLYKVNLNKYDKYLMDISKYIRDKDITNNLLDDNDYIINYLKVSAIRLYLELQDNYGIYEINQQYTASELAEKYFRDLTFDDTIIYKVSHIEKEKKSKKSKINKNIPTLKSYFGYKSVDRSRLKQTIHLLQLKIDMLDIQTTEDQLLDLLLSEDYSKVETKIHLQCETTQFSYIVSRLKPYFTNFTPKSIEHSKKFYTKTNTILKANNLYKNKVYNTKQKEEIDKIIQHLQ